MRTHKSGTKATLIALQKVHIDKEKETASVDV